MSEYHDLVKKHVPEADLAVVDGLVKHCGIALRNKDSSMVSCSDKAERDRVRDGFLKKKLARTEDDAALDEAIMAVCGKMSDTNQKSRVTFYYLLAEHFGQLDLFK